MLDSGFTFPDFPEVVDSSMRSAWVACPRQFFYSYLMGLRKSSQSVHLHFGGALARGLEVTRKGYWQDGLDEIHAVAEGLKAVILAWGDWEPTDEITSSRAGVKTLEACLDSLYSYFEQFPLGSDQIQPIIIDGEPLIEKSFALPIPNTKHPVTGLPVVYAGRFDMVGHFNDAVFVVDEKTTTSLGTWWQSNWPLRGQISGYCYGLRSYGLDAAGAIIRGVGVGKYAINFQQVMLSRPEWLVDQWLAQLARDINRAAEAWLHARDFWLEQPWEAFDQAFDAACSAYGGCGYQLLCESQHPERWFDNFVVSHWDPLKRQGDIP